MNRNKSAMSHRWDNIQATCNKFHGYSEHIRARQDSGKTMVDQVRTLNYVQFGILSIDTSSCFFCLVEGCVKDVLKLERGARILHDALLLKDPILSKMNRCSAQSQRQ
jgi:hypothetical protein